MELYRKVEIKSEADLPSGDRTMYFVGVKDNLNPEDVFEWFNYKNPVMADNQAEYWINTFDFYLQPYELDLPTEEEIKIQAHKDYPYLDVEWNITTIKRALWIACAKWMIEEIKKRNNL